MSDDLRIPVPAGSAPISASYRARRPGPEPGMRMAMIAAAGLGGLLLVGMGGWAMMGRRPAVIPVIEADSRPLRVKPENPGGMQIAGADETEANDSNSRMAPSTEAPAPQALRAQMQQSVPAPSAPTAAAGIIPTVTTPAVVQPGVSPLPDTPARPQPAARALTPAVAPRPAATGGTQVQLAAVETEAAAQSEWQRLAKRMPDLLNDRRLSVQRADREGHPVWRVRTGGFADVAEATGFCTKVRAKGGACAIASF